jgi:hypothetical protein
VGPEALTALADTLKATGPYGMVALFVVLYFKERQYAQSLNSKILDLAVKSTETAAEQTNALHSLKEVISSFRDALRG